MSQWQQELEAARFRFVEALEQRGLIAADETTLNGDVATGSGKQHVQVRLPDNFPYRPPRVHPDEQFPRSWHRERDGAMCLYGEGSDEELPWLDPDDFLAMVTRWFEESEAGWPGDLPVLDLDRYFPSSDDPHLVLYGDLTDLTYIRFKDNKLTLTVDGPAPATRRRNGKSKVNGQRVTGYVVDIGDPTLPPTNWAEVLALLDESAANTVTAAIAAGHVRYVLVQYRRGEHDGLVALEVQPDKDGTVVARNLDAASIRPTDLSLRAGTQQQALHDKHVLVVGAGALGSHICDTLARAGVGHLTIRDHATVEPGNLIRHLADDKHSGWPKVDAVADIICNRSFNTTTVSVEREPLWNPRELPDLLGVFDLVIDATASGTTTAMLTEVATVLGYRFVSACLKENGSIVRIDVIPPLVGAPLQPTAASPEGPVAVGYQTGCGDPVSLTPHLAVAEAAALAARHAVGLLTGLPISPAGVVHDYR
jgi:hypothetical protein